MSRRFQIVFMTVYTTEHCSAQRHTIISYHTVLDVYTVSCSCRGPVVTDIQIKKYKARNMYNAYICITIKYNANAFPTPLPSARPVTVILDVPTVNKRNEPVTILCAPGEEFAWRSVMVTSCCRWRTRSDTRIYVLHTLPTLLNTLEKNSFPKLKTTIYSPPVRVYQNVYYVYNMNPMCIAVLEYANIWVNERIRVPLHHCCSVALCRYY